MKKSKSVKKNPVKNKDLVLEAKDLFNQVTDTEQLDSIQKLLESRCQKLDSVLLDEEHEQLKQLIQKIVNRLAAKHKNDSLALDSALYNLIDWFQGIDRTSDDNLEFPY